ncbi:MAG: Gfo/Idh/MocA family oxidoreductase [Paracoccaceae bacterium]|nr:MAG: Gfo/Idh/MocA family oxidoreductase [Paracoccaceae bacterium]
MMQETPIAVVGAGLIGQRHLAALRTAGGVRPAAVIDPAPALREVAEAMGLPWFPSLSDLPHGVAAGAILATPNQLHVSGALDALSMGLPVLVEKPLATDVEGAGRIVDAGRAAGLPVLTGHHRRHNPLIAEAKSLIDSGGIGAIVSVHGMFWLEKPASYFANDWRRRPGAGPVLLNCIHDIDLLRHLAGEIVAVQSVVTRAIRGHAVEDAAAVVIEFASGAIGTLSVADCIPAPWSWELASGENPDYPPAGQSCYQIGGTTGALELPALRVWRHDGPRGWWDPITAATLPRGHGDPLIRQAEQFGRVIRGEEPPLVSGEDGRRSLAVALAVHRAAETRTRIVIAP